MKRLISILTIILIAFSCAVTTPSWTNIGSEGVYIENCRDTVSFNQLDSICDSHKITRNLSDWSIMNYYNSKDDMMSQWTYIRNTDTIYTITHTDSTYIFTMKSIQNNSNE